MNRVRNFNGSYQVLLTPDIDDVSSPDSSTLIGSWFEPDMRNFNVIEFTNINDAVYEALKYPDINWTKIVSDNQYIYKELVTLLQVILSSYPINVQVIPQLVTPCQLKNNIFNAAINKNADIMSIINFTIISPWSKVLDKATAAILRDILNYYKITRVKTKFGKITYLVGSTPYGCTYSIKLVPTLLYQYFMSNKSNINETSFKKILDEQNRIDSGQVFI